MANLAHCAFCLETLSASLEKRQPLGLGDVDQLWAGYWDEEADDDDDNEQQEDGYGEEEEVEAEDSAPPKPAAISRLLSPNTSSSSSSPSTTPSSSSAAESTSSSRTSLSTLARPVSDRLRPRSRAPARAGPQQAPLFVTWNTIDRTGRKSLRGCIGTFSDQPLERGLRDYALTSAFDDTRFHPIALQELPNLEVAVTLLTDFESAPGPMDWELGKHGIRLSFTYRGRRYGSTYLPDVAREQGWTKEETIVSLMRKAGWSGRKDDWKKVANMEVIRYQGKAVNLHYDAWRQWRDWVASQGYGKEHLN